MLRNLRGVGETQFVIHLCADAQDVHAPALPGRQIRCRSGAEKIRAHNVSRFREMIVVDRTCSKDQKKSFGPNLPRLFVELMIAAETMHKETHKPDKVAVAKSGLYVISSQASKQVTTTVTKRQAQNSDKDPTKRASFFSQALTHHRRQTFFHREVAGAVAMWEY